MKTIVKKTNVPLYSNYITNNCVVETLETSKASILLLWDIIIAFESSMFFCIIKLHAA